MPWGAPGRCCALGRPQPGRKGLGIGASAAKKHETEVFRRDFLDPPTPGEGLDKQRRDLDPQKFSPAAGYASASPL